MVFSLFFQVIDDATLNKLCSVIIQSGQEHAAKHLSSAPLMYAYYGTEYIGKYGCVVF